MTQIDDSLSPLNVSRPVLLVAAAVLIDGKNRLLLAQRPEGKSMSGLWEFPGGKVHENETPEEALARELREELGLIIELEDLLPLTFASYPYPEFHLFMPIFSCRSWQGTPHPFEGQNLAWVNKNEAHAYPMPPADEKILPVILELI
jgi:8-oxo-dGTP diphosphatase